MGHVTGIIKRDGERLSESFNHDKLHDSIMAACLSVRTPIGQAEIVAHAVCSGVIQWLEEKSEVTSRDIRRIAAQHLYIHHPDAAYIYEQHRITI